jgi:hypothetical protein
MVELHFSGLCLCGETTFQWFMFEVGFSGRTRFLLFMFCVNLCGLCFSGLCFSS